MTVIMMGAPMLIVAQKPVAPVTCAFDTASYREPVSLELSLRAFRGKDTVADRTLTLGLGELIRAHLAVPPSVQQLLYPYTYQPARGIRASGGTLQFDLSPAGEFSGVKWFSTSADPPTDSAIVSALRTAMSTGEATDMMTSLGWKKKEHVHVTFFVAADALRAPLARIRTTMIRLDAEGGDRIRESTPGPQLVPYDMIAWIDHPVELDYVVDQLGQVDRKRVQPVWALSSDDLHGAIGTVVSGRRTPFNVAGCPMPMRIHAIAPPNR